MFWRLLKRRAGRASPPTGRRGWAWPGSGLHVCPACHGSFVHAVDRRRESEARWWLQLCCGECRSCRDVVVTDDIARRFDADVARGLEAIAAAAAHSDRQRMADQADAFAVALERDLIDAADFRL
jgi:hypothetical protein